MMLRVAPSGEIARDDPPSAGAIPPWRAAGIWLIPGLVALAVGWWGRLAVGITRDESTTIDVSTRTLPQIWQTAHHADAVHAAYYMIMHLWIGAFGTTPLTVRLPSLIGTAIAASLLAILGRTLLSPRAGLTAGLLYACAPQVSSFAHDARSYGMDSALAIALVMIFVYAMRSPRRWPWLGYGLVLPVTVVMHLFTLLIVPAQGITIMWYARHQRSWQPLRRWAVTATLAVAALAPFLLAAISQGGTADWIPRLRWSDIGTFIANMAGGWVLIGPMLVLAAFAIRMRRDTPGAPGVPMIAAPWLVVPPALLFLGSLWDPLYVFRYLLYCLPALMLLVAAGMDRLHRWLHLLVLAALLVATIPMQRSVRATDLGVADLRGQAAYIAAHKRPGDAIVFLDPAQRQFTMSYPPAYAGLQDLALARTPAQAANFSGTDVPTSVLRERLRGADRVWAVKYWVLASKRAGNRAYEQQRYDLLEAVGLHWVSTRHFRGGAILLFERRTP